ncbi:hypothetical protein [Streptomyces alanosinicus]|uniref:Uncharacterized protein n=1 Tax=Streptomyces alanosinicus TaxID=68171 RepID=A0A918YJ64_9ACTN|nr:hypothetical protein [Streptomyces alanosinicus]GHE04893.1 hypothetical protein GCM10010339_38330 [Streptomyces alanosinicus]
MPAPSRPALRTAALLTAAAALGVAAWNPSPASAATHRRLVVTQGGTAAHPAVYDGHGRTYDFVIRDNYCDTRKASQALMFEDVQHLTIVGNTFAAPTDHAIGLAIHSTGAHVCHNRTNPRVRYEVGIDAFSRPRLPRPEAGRRPLTVRHLVRTARGRTPARRAGTP